MFVGRGYPLDGAVAKVTDEVVKVTDEVVKATDGAKCERMADAEGYGTNHQLLLEEMMDGRRGRR